MGSICIGLFFLAILNFSNAIGNMDIIMTGISIYSGMMAMGQFLYKSKDIIESEAFKYADVKTQKSYKRRFSAGEHVIASSLMVSIGLTSGIHALYPEQMTTISNSVTLIALASLFLYIGAYED